MGFSLSGVVGKGSSSLVVDGCGGVSRGFGIVHLGMSAVIDPGIDLREGEVWKSCSLLWERGPF